MQLSYYELKTTQMLRLSYTNINIMVGRFWHAVVMRGQKKSYFATCTYLYPYVLSKPARYGRKVGALLGWSEKKN